MLSSQVMGGGGFMNSPATPPPEQRTRRNDPIIPVTCKMIDQLVPNEEKILIGTREFTNVRVYGKIIEVNKDSLKIDYKIQDEDNGPSVAIRQFMNEKTLEKEEGMWVMVTGRLRTFQSEKSVVSFSIVPAGSEEEVNCHRLECKYAQLFYEKDILGRLHDEMAFGKSRGLAGTSFAPQPILGGGSGLPTSTGVRPGGFDQFKPGTSGSDGNISHGAGVTNGPPPEVYSGGLQGLRAQLHAMIQPASDTVQGLSIQDIQGRLPGVKLHEIRKAIDYLSAEGHVYSTIDDDHFKVCE